MNPESHDPNEAIMKKLHAHRWTGRLLTTAALGIGLLSIAVGVLVAVANLNLVIPLEGRLLQSHPELMQRNETNNVASLETQPTLSKEQSDRSHLLVTFAHGKELMLTAAAVILVGLGTFVTLLLVIFNRHVTLRQVNASLTQISQQIKELQERGPKA